MSYPPGQSDTNLKLIFFCAYVRAYEEEKVTFANLCTL